MCIVLLILSLAKSHPEQLTVRPNGIHISSFDRYSKWKDWSGKRVGSDSDNRAPWQQLWIPRWHPAMAISRDVKKRPVSIKPKEHSYHGNLKKEEQGFGEPRSYEPVSHGPPPRPLSPRLVLALGHSFVDYFQ
jgi:hypothetical protein